MLVASRSRVRQRSVEGRGGGETVVWVPDDFILRRRRLKNVECKAIRRRPPLLELCIHSSGYK
jgi:hypothetical protein